MVTGTAKKENPGTVALRPYERFIKYMQDRAETTGNQSDRGFDIAAGQMDKILAAETIEDIWDADEGGMISGQDLVDVEQRVREFVVLRSEREEFDTGLGVYLVVSAVRLADGLAIVWNTGASGLIAKLRALEAKNALPVDCVIKGIQTNSGNTVLKLRPVPKRAVPGTVIA